MANSTPLLKEVVKIKTNISLLYLDTIKQAAERSKKWHFLYGGGPNLEDKFPKLDIIEFNSNYSYLSGLVTSLFIQIYEAGGYKYFKDDIFYCGVSIKDKYRKDNIHVDHDKEKTPTLKILGILNHNWDSSWGGGFLWGNKHYPLNVNEFLIFDPRIPHASADILCDKKRLAIDFSVRVEN
jgi:hypothetical protein